MFYKKRCFNESCQIHKKTPLSESLLIKLQCYSMGVWLRRTDYLSVFLKKIRDSAIIPFFLLQKFNIFFYHSYVSICKDLQRTIVLSSGPLNYAHSLGRNQETAWFRVLKLIFVNRLIQRIPLNHYKPFYINDLKVLEH